MFLHPIQATLVLIQAAFESVPPWQVMYGVLYSLLWLGIAYYFSQRAFYRFVIMKQGVRA
jgi:fluoroquinolone transport system permease protein